MKKKVVFIIMILISIAMIIIGINIKNNTSIEIKSDTNDEIKSNGPILKTKKDVMKQLKKGGVSASYIGKDENGCWNFDGDNSRVYTYCLSDGYLTSVSKNG